MEANLLRKNQEEAKLLKSDREPVRIEVKVLAWPRKIMQMWHEKERNVYKNM